MGSNRPIRTKDFEKWLRSKGLKLVRTKGSHHIWNRQENKLSRSIVFQGNEKEVPNFIIKNDIELLGISYEEFLKELENL